MPNGRGGNHNAAKNLTTEARSRGGSVSPGNFKFNRARASEVAKHRWEMEWKKMN
jgi:general stress protein YciG